VLCAGFTLLLGEEAPTSTTHQQVVWRHCPECYEAGKHHLLKFGFLLLDWLPWFHNWGKTCCCAHHTFSWGFQLVGHIHYKHHTITAPPSLLGTAPPACALTRASSPSRRRRPQCKSRPWPPMRSSAMIQLPKMCRCSLAAGPSLRALLLPMASPPVAVDALEVVSS
jgi:hypothetical protein